LQLGFLKVALWLSLLTLLTLFFVFILLLVEIYKVLFLGNAPYVPSSKKLIDKILQEIDFKENSLVYELGCGNAKFLRKLAKQKNVQAIGYEYFIIPFLLAKLLTFLNGNRIKIYCQDFFKVDLSQADYIFCFLISQEMLRLETKLAKELRPGALVISNAFQFKSWQPEKIIILDQNKKTGLNNKIYIYRK
jgi:SAM-dependent methyltransferase